jgi:flagellar capping protein FliD
MKTKEEIQEMIEKYNELLKSLEVLNELVMQKKNELRSLKMRIQVYYGGLR